MPRVRCIVGHFTLSHFVHTISRGPYSFNMYLKTAHVLSHYNNEKEYEYEYEYDSGFTICGKVSSAKCQVSFLEATTSSVPTACV